MRFQDIPWASINHSTLHAYIEPYGTLGIFYNSTHKTRHIMPYVPYKKLPEITLCGEPHWHRGHWTSTGNTNKMCEKCVAVLEDATSQYQLPPTPNETNR